eukprot:2954850-Rhodomonas_salina.4
MLWRDLVGDACRKQATPNLCSVRARVTTRPAFNSPSPYSLEPKPGMRLRGPVSTRMSESCSPRTSRYEVAALLL